MKKRGGGQRDGQSAVVTACIWCVVIVRLFWPRWSEGFPFSTSLCARAGRASGKLYFGLLKTTQPFH